MRHLSSHILDHAPLAIIDAFILLLFRLFFLAWLLFGGMHGVYHETPAPGRELYVYLELTDPSTSSGEAVLVGVHQAIGHLYALYSG
jgi:hypothetical protein